VKIERVALTDGKVSIPVPWKSKKLGHVAPTKGLPEVDWSKRQDLLAVTW